MASAGDVPQAPAYSMSEPEIFTMKHELQPTSDREEFSFEAVSALFDGEGDPASVDQFLSASADPEAHAQWTTYALIGDVLRAPGEHRLQSSAEFLAGVRAQLASQPPVQVAVESQAAVTVPTRDAANDSVFRWKMVAGFASLAAVAAVGWSTWLGSGVTGPVAAPQLVQAPASSPEAVLVATPQGAVVRDPRLEQLLAEHRQHGGMTALQASTGFLRNATFDAGDNR